ncbi:MAG TPA: hypothetical protein VI789_05335 [Dehalococcoidia bacterium]|nr:hypothetical protein [Dehalococcoidia bacterium]
MEAISTYLRLLFTALFELVRSAHRAQSAFAGTTIALIGLLGGGTMLATVTLSDGTFAFDQLEDLYQGSVSRVSGSLELRGAVIATASGKPMQLETLQLTLGSFGNGAAVSLLEDAPASQRLVITYLDRASYRASIPYTAREVIGDSDGLLEPGELAQITIHASDLPQPLGVLALGASQRWTLELISPLGGSVEVSRTLPGILQPVMRLP